MGLYKLDRWIRWILSQTVLAVLGVHLVLAQDHLALKSVIERPTCHCCIGDPGGACCQNYCNIASLVPEQSRVPSAMIGLLSHFSAQERLASFSIAKSGPPSPLGKCAFRSALNIDNYVDAGAAKEFYDLASVTACDAFVPELLQARGDILAASSVGGITSAQRQISRKYVDICLSPSASIYKPELSTAETQRISRQLLLLVDDNGRPYCHGFYVKGRVVTADHCLRGRQLTDVLHVRSVSDPKPRDAVIEFRGGESNSAHPERDVALLKISAPSSDSWILNTISMGPPVPKGRLLLVQVSIYELIAAAVPYGADLSGALMSEDNPSCRLFGIGSGGLLLNGCQSDSGTSGAPYIQREASGEISLVGVHAGSTDLLTAQELHDCSISLPNYGVALPIRELLQKMGSP